MSSGLSARPHSPSGLALPHKYRKKLAAVRLKEGCSQDITCRKVGRDPRKGGGARGFGTGAEEIWPGLGPFAAWENHITCARGQAGGPPTTT